MYYSISKDTKVADKSSMLTHRLLYVFVVRKQQSQIFSRQDPFIMTDFLLFLRLFSCSFQLLRRILRLYAIRRGSYMSAHVLLNLLNELGKKR